MNLTKLGHRIRQYEHQRNVFSVTVMATGVQNTRQRAGAMAPRDFAGWTNGICYVVTEAVLKTSGMPALKLSRISRNRWSCGSPVLR